MDTQIILGGFVFQDLEIPAQINFGGDQKLIVHELVGGQRVVDAMGPSDANITWSGLFTGPDALTRALQIDSLRNLGQPLIFTFFNLFYYVLIENFTANVERFYQVNYSITLKVVNDFNYPAEVLSLLGFGESIIADFTAANAIASLINIPTITNAMGGLNTALGSVASFTNAPVATISSITGPLNSAQGSVSQQIAAVQQRLFGS